MTSMRYSVNKPNIPIVWLDTHAITSIGYAKYKKTNLRTPQEQRLIDVANRLTSLVRQGKVICFESDQLMEIESRPELVKLSTTVLSQISQGLSSHYQFPKDYQLQIGMKAFANNTNGEIIIEWETAFHDNPFSDRSVGDFLIRADIPSSKKAIAERRETNQNITSRWEEIRQDLLNEYNTEAIRFKVQHKAEKYGEQKVFDTVLRQVAERRQKGIQPSENEIFTELELIGMPLTTLKRYKKEGGIGDLFKFYASDYFMQLPFFKIRSLMYAAKLAGSEVIKISDKIDIENISAFLPYSSYMVLDRAMIDKVKKYKLDEEYSVSAIKITELDDILVAIEGNG